MSEDQRQDPRYPSEIPIQITSVPIGSGRGRTLHNVSLGGIACYSDEPAKQGQWMTIDFQLGELKLHFRGRVVWCKPSEGRYEIGLRFAEGEEEFEERMREQLCEIERYRHEILMLEGRQLSSDEAAREWISKYAADFH